jgi:putative mRNA 3-end processing factor
LLKACKATEAECVYATHGFQSAFSRYLREQGINAKEVKTEYGDDEEEGPKATDEQGSSTGPE